MSRISDDATGITTGESKEWLKGKSSELKSIQQHQVPLTCRWAEDETADQTLKQVYAPRRSRTTPPAEGLPGQCVLHCFDIASDLNPVGGPMPQSAPIEVPKVQFDSFQGRLIYTLGTPSESRVRAATSAAQVSEFSKSNTLQDAKFLIYPANRIYSSINRSISLIMAFATFLTYITSTPVGLRSVCIFFDGSADADYFNVPNTDTFVVYAYSFSGGVRGQKINAVFCMKLYKQRLKNGSNTCPENEAVSLIMASLAL